MSLNKNFLFELGCEELPAKNLKSFAEYITQNILDNIIKKNNLDFQSYQIFVTPRRIGLLIKNLAARSADKKIVKKGPHISAPEAAKLGFAKSCGVNLNKLETENDYLMFHT